MCDFYFDFERNYDFKVRQSMFTLELKTKWKQKRKIPLNVVLGKI